MTYLLIFLFGLLGIIAHTFVKIKGINKRTPPEVSIKTIITTYLRLDFPSIILSVIGLFVWMGFYDAYIKTGGKANPIPWVAKSYQDFFLLFINVMTFFIAYGAESLLIAGFGKTEAFLKKIFGDENCPPE